MCFVDQLYPDTGMNMVKVLEKLGCEVSYNTKQTCCGQPAFNAGYRTEAKSVATKFLHDFSDNSYIVGPSGSCTGYVRNFYDELFENSVSERIGTSSIPFGLIMAGITPKPFGSQSEFAATVSCNLTKASVLGTPTLN